MNWQIKFLFILFSSLFIFAVYPADNFIKITVSPARRNAVIDGSSIPKIKPSDLIKKLKRKKSEDPNISAKKLAAYANELLKKDGFDYTFYWEPKGKENEENLNKIGNGSENFLPFYYNFTEINSKKRSFQLMNTDFSHPCFNVIDIPLTSVNGNTMTVIADGKEVILKRPKDFHLEDFALLDKSLKKTIRKWTTPIDATPVGISEDGKKVYFERYDFYQNENDSDEGLDLAVEISEDGKLKFVDLNEIKSGQGIDLGTYPKDTEGALRKYKIGKKEFIINYNNPCT